jgi:peptide/nickel transport system substrate-binding protein
MSVADGSLIATKVQAGEADLQARGLVFGDLPVLKKGEKDRGYEVRLWPQANAAAIAIYPNLTVNDPVLRELFRDRRFRAALSHATDRQLLNEVLYYGLGAPSANIVLPESPLYEAEIAGPLPYDPARANALLDEIGLTERDSEGIRLLPDGRPLEIIVETAGEKAIEIDALELIKDNWAEVGVGLFPRPSQRDVLRNRAFSGDLAMSVWSGYDNGLPSADMPPDERVPVSTIFLTGPAWGAWEMSGGESGEKPAYAPAAELMDLYNAWLSSADPQDRAAAWEDILKIHADEVLTIGTVQGVVQPVVVTNRLENVPEKAIYGWDPGAQFGLYRPDEFYFEDGE